MERERRSPEEQYAELSSNIAMLEEWVKNPTLSPGHTENDWEAERMQVLMTIRINGNMVDRIGIVDKDNLKTKAETLKQRVEALTLPPTKQENN